MARDGRLGVGIIGAGRVGPVIGAALGGAGHAVIGITSGSDDERASAVLPDVPVLDALEVVRRAELVVIAVPSEQLPSLVAGIAEVGGCRSGSLVLHTDPAYGIDVLRPAAERGAIPLAVHPRHHVHGDLDRPASTAGGVRRGDSSGRGCCRSPRRSRWRSAASRS